MIAAEPWLLKIAPAPARRIFAAGPVRHCFAHPWITWRYVCPVWLAVADWPSWGRQRLRPVCPFRCDFVLAFDGGAAY